MHLRYKKVPSKLHPTLHYVTFNIQSLLFLSVLFLLFLSVDPSLTVDPTFIIGFNVYLINCLSSFYIYMGRNFIMQYF